MHHSSAEPFTSQLWGHLLASLRQALNIRYFHCELRYFTTRVTTTVVLRASQTSRSRPWELVRNEDL